MALAGPDVPERPRHITVPIGGGLFVYLPTEPTPLRLAHGPLVNAWGALQRWVKANPEERVLFWRANWQVLLFNLWREGLVALWGRDAPELSAKLTRLDFVLPERHSHLFDPFDMFRYRLHYLPADRWFYDVHVSAVMPAAFDLRQPDLPLDDPRDNAMEITGSAAPEIPPEDLAYARELLKDGKVIPPVKGGGSWQSQALKFSEHIKPRIGRTITEGQQTRRLVNALKYIHDHPAG